MKTKYVVLRESSHDVTNGHSSYSKVKSFRNEPEAMAFITDPKKHPPVRRIVPRTLQL